MPYAIDLFCGAGGMSEGILQAGFHILFSNDVNADVQATYVHRHEQLGYIQGENTYFHLGDIRELTGEYVMECIRSLRMFTEGATNVPDQIDAVFGGPPCQGFSRAGRRDKNDPRNMLFKEYLRVINQIRPKYVVMENVEGFTDSQLENFEGVTGTIYHGDVLVPEILLHEFHNIGYLTLEPQILDASDFGVPQKRKRVIFIAYLDGQVTPQYPTPVVNEDHKVSIIEALSDISLKTKQKQPFTRFQTDSRNGRTPTIHGETVSSKGKVYNFDKSNHQAIIAERFSLYKEGEDNSALRRRILRNGIDLRHKPHLIQLCLKHYDGGMSEAQLIKDFQDGNVSIELLDVLVTKKAARTKLHRDEPSLTVLTLPDDYISPFENRIFTVREMARLQSFDDSFEFLGKRTTGGSRRKLEVPQYTQVGNAVPPLLAKAIALQIINVL